MIFFFYFYALVFRMKKITLLLIFLLSATIQSFSQIIHVADEDENFSVSDAAIVSGNSVIYTGTSGKADISAFAKSDSICIIHFTYERKCISYNELEKLGFSITLRKKIFAVGESVISANRWEQNKKEVPNKITIIPKIETDLLEPQNAADLLGISGEVFIQKSQLGGGSPVIRGFATNRVLIVVDGVRMNNAIYREGNIQNVISIDPHSIESSEVIFGPGASTYGSDAIGGVMDFHTKPAMFSTGNGTYIKSESLLRHSTANKEKTVHFDFNAGSRKMAFLTSLSYSDYNDLRMGSRGEESYLRTEYVKLYAGKDSVFKNSNPLIQKFSGYSQLNLMNKLRFRISETSDLAISAHYSRLSDVPRYDRLIQYKSGKLRYGEWYYGPQTWFMSSVQLTLNKPVKLYDKAKITASVQDYTESRHDRSFGNNTINEQTERVKIAGLNIDFDKELGGDHEYLFYGFEMAGNDIRSDANTRNILTEEVDAAGSRYPNGTNRYINLAVYSGYKNNIFNKMTISAGLRYNYVSLNSTISDNSYYSFPFEKISISNGALTGSAGSVYRVNDKLHFNFNLSSGFRAPNLDDAGKVFDSAPGIVVVPNPSLRPEYAINTDLGVVKEFGRIIRAEVTLFYTRLENAMARGNFLFNGEDSIDYMGEYSKVEAVVNSGYANVYGIHAGINATISKNITFKSNINITEGVSEDGTPWRHAAPLFGTSQLIYSTEKIKADLYTVYNGARTFEKLAVTEREKAYLYASDSNGNPWSPGWATLNLKLSYEITGNFTINIGAENILDTRYRPYSSGIAAPGRNFIFSLRFKA